MKIEERFMLGLRQTSGFDIRVAAMELELSISSEWMSRVHELQQAGIIEFDGTILKLTPRGRLVASSATEELIWASPRELLNIFQADDVGCHIITVTDSVLTKLQSVGKDLNDFSLETVQMFYNDAAKSGFTL
jgi:transaldolase